MSCRSSNHLSGHCLTCNLFFLLFFAFGGTYFAWYFWRALNTRAEASDGNGKTAVKVYLLSATVFVWISFYMLLVAPTLQLLELTSPSMALCATVTCAAVAAHTCAYFAFQRILWERLQVPFANTTHTNGCGQFCVNGFKIFQCFIFMLRIGFLAAEWLMRSPKCISSHFYEMPDKKFKVFCVPNSESTLTVMGYVLMDAVLVGNLALIGTYVWRLKAAFIDANCRPAIESELSSKTKTHSLSSKASRHVVLGLDLIRKSAVASVCSVCISFTGLAAWPLATHQNSVLRLLPVVDLVINEVLIYCLFPMGDDFYDALFGRCHFAFDCCIPREALAVERTLAIELAVKKREQRRAKASKGQRRQPKCEEQLQAVDETDNHLTVTGLRSAEDFIWSLLYRQHSDGTEERPE